MLPISSSLPESYSRKVLPAPADTGVRYGSASGDYQLHHLYPWTARLVGYNQPIAHGMWTLSRALATIQEGKYLHTYHPQTKTAIVNCVWELVIIGTKRSQISVIKFDI